MALTRIFTMFSRPLESYLPVILFVGGGIMISQSKRDIRRQK